MRTTIALAAFTITISCLVAAPAWPGGGGHEICSTTSGGTFLAMRDSCFEGVVHRVEAGTTLRVTNAGALPHTVTAVDGSFDSGQLRPGETYEIELDAPGSVDIYCTLHGTAEGDGMAGVIQVTGADGTVPASATTAPALPSTELAAGLLGLVVGAAGHRRWNRRHRVRAGA